MQCLRLVSHYYRSLTLSDCVFFMQVATRWYRAPELLYGSRDYTEGVDLWAVGCVLAELLNNCPLFPGENDIDQLGLVIRHLGTPTEEVWPGVSTLPDFSKITFPDTAGVSFEEMIPEAPASALDLVALFVNYNSAARISAKEALRHEYFYEKPFPATLEEMTRPREKKFDTGSNDFYTEIPFHKHFDKLLSIVDDD